MITVTVVVVAEPAALYFMVVFWAVLAAAVVLILRMMVDISIAVRINFFLIFTSPLQVSRVNFLKFRSISGTVLIRERRP
jgi:hypothetical protein